MKALKRHYPYFDGEYMDMKTKKHLGQHILTDKAIVDKVVDAIQTHCPTDRSLMEVGPGPGTLTHALAAHYPSFCAVEYDKDMIRILRQTLPVEKVRHDDFLQLDFDAVFSGEPFNLVGNFPYNISSQIVFKLLEHRARIPVMVGMFQKEVAERICAAPGSKANGIITLRTQAYYGARKLWDVPPSAFSPPPKVDSSVIVLERLAVSLVEGDEKLYASLIKMSFQQRRKKLRNSLKSFINERQELQDMEVLQKRPEQLGVEDFVQLTRLLSAPDA